MATLFNDQDRATLVRRIDSLSPDSTRQWGTMTLTRTLSHMADQLHLAFGEIDIPPIGGPLSLPPLRWLVIYVLPIPKGVKTAPRLVAGDCETVDEGKRHLLRQIKRFVDREQAAFWAAHPLFGNLSGKDWGVLAAKHLDHHLRQFGA